MAAMSWLLTSLAVAAPAPKEPPAKQAEGIEGKWQLVAVEEKGEPAYDPDEPMTLTIKDGEMTFRRGDDPPFTYRFAVDVSKSPHHLDLKIGPKGGVCHAVLGIGKVELVLCAGSKFNADKEADRPKELSTGPPEDRPRKGKLLFRFKRVKE